MIWRQRLRRIVAGLALFLPWAVFSVTPAQAAQPECAYTIAPRASADLRDLVVDVTIGCTENLLPKDFAFGYGGENYADWRRLDDGRLTYAARLGALARAARSADFSATPRGVMAPVDAWLGIRTTTSGKAAFPIVQDAKNQSGIRFLHNLTAASAPQAEGAITRDDWVFGGYTVFTDRKPMRVMTPGPSAFLEPGRKGFRQSEITVAVLDDGFAMDDAAITAWITRFAGLVGRYWGGFPADTLLVAVTPHRRVNDPFGRVRGGGGATLLMRISKQDTPQFLHERDWVLTHELIHVGAPFAPARRPWFMEGMATYLEPLIRGLGGAIPRQAVWDEWARAMPTGAAAFNTEGLDGRGHPYWSGALFFLLAQYETAKLGRADGLAPCFRAFRSRLGDASQRTNIHALMRICDEALGAPVMSDLYRRHAKPTDFDIRPLWKALGIKRGEDGAHLAPEGAAMRDLFFNSAQFPEPLT